MKRVYRYACVPSQICGYSHTRRKVDDLMNVFGWAKTRLDRKVESMEFQCHVASFGKTASPLAQKASFDRTLIFFGAQMRY